MSGFNYFNDDCTTLVDVFYQRAREDGGIYFRFKEEDYAYSKVYRTALAYGAFFAERGLKPGDRIGVAFNNNPQFFYAFWGAVLMGAVAVPLAPGSDVERLRAVTDDCNAKLVLIDPESADDLTGPGYVSGNEASAWCDAHSLPPVQIPHKAHINDLLFLQYTSGTTGQSKGVALSHRAIMANLAGLMDRMQVDPESDSFSILIPMFHDMGLIGFGLGSLYAGVKLILFRQDIRNLYRWMESFANQDVTISGCSNTILHLTVRAVLDPSKYDLSPLRMMIVGSEPVIAETVERFETTYNRTKITVPAYGLAEISLCATMTPPGEGIRVDNEGYVSCGKALKDVAIKIDGGATGEILIKAPSAMDGYFERSSKNHLTTDGFLKTGDLGRMDDEGYLYVCGRIKNVIIRDGKNLAPHELEEVAKTCKPVRLAAVFALPEQGRDLIVLVCEVPKIMLGKDDKTRALYLDIYKQASANCRYRPDRVIFTAPASIPHSLNGKMQHQKLREMVADGTFGNQNPTRIYPE